ncbi:MAG: DUF1616 domain-containing protein [Dehalococcoidales bacterium]|nr:DUF1616 domain-containing protein [Dehalococcoidales bacterium]
MEWLAPIRGLIELVFPFLERLPAIRVAIAFLLVFFLPGLSWTGVLFRQINIIERVALSFGLSIAIVTLSILFANRLFDTGISGFNSLMVILTVTIVPAVVYYLNRLIGGRKESEE